uniref:Uncharacterized protein n=1 Tax=Attheya septentrionalis TaxID=420275 RepID=A0A7S2UET3_9STRA|mmetsp:Transcript_22559/g.40714  ORF Transcript_22559/g.40714 Transcript_22559/m.40714 type:complete len:553 (+) Transcript_22559:110-1768(+)
MPKRNLVRKRTAASLGGSRSVSSSQGPSSSTSKVAGRNNNEDDEEDRPMKRRKLVLPTSAGKISSSSDSTISDTEESTSPDCNLTGVEPYLDMRLEIRDPDFIWSSAKLIDLQKRGGKNIVTIRYDGWGDEWDELLEYPNVRLARLYTYTKEVRCWVDIMTKKKRKAPPKKDGKHWCTIWPCRVKFRMPHPVGDQIRRSKELLRVETNVFCVPYGQELLPNYIQQSILNGGRWINVRRLRQWKTDDLGAQLESEKKNFDQAMNVCLADNGKFGFLPKGAVDNGSLLRDEFRVKTVGGEPVGGVMYCGDFTPVVFHITKKPAPKPPQNDSPPNSKDSPIRVEQAERPLPKFVPPEYQPPPCYPKAIQIEEPVYPCSGIKRCKKTNKWSASVDMGGNDVFLGLFPTQTQAFDAIQLALRDDTPGRKQDVLLRTTKKQHAGGGTIAHLKDMEAVSIESLIHAREQHSQPTEKFSLHEWTMQLIRHKTYLEELQSSKAQFEAVQQSATREHCSTSDNNINLSETKCLSDNTNKKTLSAGKKKGAPRRVDLEKRRYM